MWLVNGKQSYGVARFTAYPCFVRYFKSLASVSGPHDTYTTLSGDSLTTDDKNSSLLPVLGGSIMTTSAFSPFCAISTMNFPASSLYKGRRLVSAEAFCQLNGLVDLMSCRQSRCFYIYKNRHSQSLRHCPYTKPAAGRIIVTVYRGRPLQTRRAVRRLR